MITRTHQGLKKLTPEEAEFLDRKAARLKENRDWLGGGDQGSGDQAATWPMLSGSCQLLERVGGDSSASYGIAVWTGSLHRIANGYLRRRESYRVDGWLGCC